MFISADVEETGAECRHHSTPLEFIPPPLPFSFDRGDAAERVPPLLSRAVASIGQPSLTFCCPWFLRVSFPGSGFLVHLLMTVPSRSPFGPLLLLLSMLPEVSQTPFSMCVWPSSRPAAPIPTSLCTLRHMSACRTPYLDVHPSWVFYTTSDFTCPPWSPQSRLLSPCPPL